MKTSCKFHRLPGTQSRVITKVHDLLGQPSYIFKIALVISENVRIAFLYVLSILHFGNVLDFDL